MAEAAAAAVAAPPAEEPEAPAVYVLVLGGVVVHQ